MSSSRRPPQATPAASLSKNDARARSTTRTSDEQRSDPATSSSAARARRDATRSTGDVTPPRQRAAEKPGVPPAGLTVGRIPIVDVMPVVSGGRRPARAVPGETFAVSATVFREGHDAVAANVVLYDPEQRPGPWTPMREVGIGLDRYEAEVTPTREGDWSFQVEAWSDPVATWRHTAEVKLPAGIDVELVTEDGARLLERAAAERRAAATATALAEAVLLDHAAAVLRDDALPATGRLATALDDAVTAVLDTYPLRDLVTTSERYPLRVDRERALYGAWYEFFPRSEGALVYPNGLRPPRSGTFATAARRLPAVAAMGFDVVYLPPIHPIGVSYRKGRNNALTAGPDDVGSPWAIGGPMGDGTRGGHTEVHPDLGTIEDFDAFVARANELGLEVALDFALQCSPDHPWVSEHPEWFGHRSDGTIAYAENPPKKYQDIYPLYFDADFEGLYAECLRVLRHWMAHGVRIFRVDNPHTKPLVFWERLLNEIAATDPDVVFLAEAFTRPAMLHALARIGFHQSYTYFTWRNTKQELTDYLTELSRGPESSYLRPNLFVNTPDILHAYLQHGGREAFCVRAVLAATAGPSWGVYSGYELCENVAREPGSEEYLDSEKYQLRPRDWQAAEASGRSISPLIRLLNEFRREHVALRELRNLRFHTAYDDSVLCYSKRSVRADGSEDVVIVVLNLDPFTVKETTVALDLPALFPHDVDPWSATFQVRDALTGGEYRWGRENYVRLDPHFNIGHVFAVNRAP